MSIAPEFSALPSREREPRRRLHAVEVPRRRRRPRLAYAIVALAGAVAIGAAQMALSILTTQTSYEIARLTSEQRELTWQKQILYDDIAGLSSPQYLAANAAALGMVINQAPAYLRLSDGEVLGAAKGAKSTSSVDALGRGSVANALIADTPLVTDPDATIEGAPVDTDGALTETPPPITEGLPTPRTR